ncbi:hypothetical protein BPOR_0496g00060 [Botrytis porri]|uniref:Uncharacterized protein n=1 Tax=Botrytis porri TaxID=87229 RepID=A0A4Z1KLQ4_9HELO|nr:hypothetical protein BPOR_0496g00060 [Botrytis porri]
MGYHGISDKPQLCLAFVLRFVRQGSTLGTWQSNHDDNNYEVDTEPLGLSDETGTFARPQFVSFAALFNFLRYHVEDATPLNDPGKNLFTEF